MVSSDYVMLRNVVTTDEGRRLKPYVDTAGKLTIGVGRNLTDVGISDAEADMLLDHDLPAAEAALLRAFPIVATLNGPRQIVLVSMAFNLGLPRLSQFTQMWAAIQAGNFAEAAIQMLDSTWADQVGARARRLAETMHAGELTHTYMPLWAKAQGATS